MPLYHFSEDPSIRLFEPHVAPTSVESEHHAVSLRDAGGDVSLKRCDGRPLGEPRTVVPQSVEPVGDLLAAIAGAGVELRITPSLVELWRRVIASSLEFSGTRLHNARGWHELFGAGSGR